jgi:chaperonin GroES
MNIKPLSDRIVVERVEAEQEKHGLIIPDTAREKPQEGKVIAVGRGRTLPSGELKPLHVGEGDRILFGKFAGSEVRIGEKEYLILREDEVLGIFERTAPHEEVVEAELPGDSESESSGDPIIQDR